MFRLATLTAAAALVLAFGFAGTAQADPWGDSVTSSAGVTGTLTDVLGAPDQMFIQIPDTVSVTVEFTDNVANPDGTGAADLSIDTFDMPFPGAAIIEVSDDGTTFVTLTAPPLNDPGRVCAGPGGGSLFCNYDDLAAGFITFDLDPTGLAFVTHVRLTDLVGNIDDEFAAPAAGFDLDAVVALTNFDLGTGNITKTNLGAGTIDIQSKGGFNALQFFNFKITLTNPNSVDLTDIVFEDVLPAEFDLDPVAEDVADGNGIDACANGDGVCDGVAVTAELNGANCTATGAEHTNQGKSNKTFKLQPDIITITADPGDGDVLVGNDVCEITVWARTDQKATGSKKVNFTPTECPSNGVIILNEGVEVIDTMGTVETSDDVTLLVDDDSLFLVCATSMLAFVDGLNSDGDLGGLSGADQICQTEADNAGLVGTFIAWLSDSSTDAKDRFDPAFASLPYLRTSDNAVVADDFADLIDGSIDNIILSKADGTVLAPSGGFGQVWTGTAGDGTKTSDTCNDWTDGTDSFEGTAGRVQSTNSQWTDHLVSDCDGLPSARKASLYCFQKNTF